MAFSLTQYANVATSTPGVSLDNNFKLFGLLAPIPCTVAGTNTLTLTQQTTGSGAPSTSIAVAAYANYLQLCGVAAQTNSGAVTAALGALGALPVYKDSISGPIALVGNEIVAACSFTLIYDSALNSGGGGFHLVSTTVQFQTTITPTLVRAGGVQIGATVSPTLTGIQSALATLAFTSIVPNATQDQLFSMASVNFGDALAFGFPSLASVGLGITGFIMAAGTVTGSVFATIAVRMSNVTAASTIIPGTMTIRATAFRTG